MMCHLNEGSGLIQRPIMDGSEAWLTKVTPIKRLVSVETLQTFLSAAWLKWEFQLAVRTVW